MCHRILLFLALFVFLSHSVAAQVKINEFLIDPHPQQVELVNLSTTSADISRWYIDDSSGSTYFTIPQNTILPPFSCSVFSSDFNLNKSSSDTVRLFDSTAPPTSTSAALIDSFTYTSSPGFNISFQHIPDASSEWATGPASIGLWNSTRLMCTVEPTQTPSPQPSFSPTISTATPTLSASVSNEISNVFISETMVHPQTNEKEWIEIYNKNDFSVYLNDWYIDDIENAGGAPIKFNLSLGPNQYGVIELNSSVFNNDADEVRLLDSQKQVVDYFVYTTSEKGLTFSRKSFLTHEFCTTSQTKGFTNNPCEDINITAAPLTIGTQSQTPIDIPIYPTTPISTSFIRTMVTPMKPNMSPNPEDAYEQSVLGIETTHPKTKTGELPHYAFLFPSFSFAFLTIVSVFLRMKTGL